MRSIFVVGNWKMNHGLSECEEFFSALPELSNQIHSWIAPQAIHIPLALKNSSEKNIKIGSQDCGDAVSGAYTGQVSAKNLKEIGAEFTLVGHSERRAIQNESNELLNAKIKTALECGLKVIYCVGETLEEREGEQTLKVLENQITEGLKDLDYNENNLIIAYEPVWAIGTGKTATPEMANDAHKHIRSLLKSSEKISILYGGSVKPSNFKELLGCNHIDGGLVGGASLKATDYLELVKIAETL